MSVPANRSVNRQRLGGRLLSVLATLVFVLSAFGFASATALAAGPPSVSGVSPSRGPEAGGTVVAISGEELSEATAVSFGAAPATTFTVESPTSITATAPAGTAIVDVTVTTPEGTSPTSPADHFRYQLAGPPDFGKCVKVSSEKEGKKTVFHGDFKNKSCKTASPSKTGKYEWQAGVAKTGFTTSGVELKLETTSGAFIACATEHGSGEVAGPREFANVLITLTGCKGPTGPCTTPGAAGGEVATGALGGKLGIISSAKKNVASELTADGGGNWFTMFCGAEEAPVTLRGTSLVPIGVYKTQTSYALNFFAKRGVQKPERFEGGPLALPEVSFVGGPFLPGGLNAIVTITLEEPLEINPTA
jgi:hypothetical protein